MDMDVMGIANAYGSVMRDQVQMAVQTKMLHTAMDNQVQAVQDLLGTIPQTVSAPSFLGNNIDIRV